MTKKLLRWLAVASLLIGSLTITAPPTRAAFSACEDFSTHSRFQGNVVSSTLSSSIVYVAAYITPGREFFGPCSTGTGPLQHDGAFAFVAIQPELSTGKTGIMQIGIADCADSSFTICRGKQAPRFFAGIKTCGLSNQYWDLGAADYNRWQYKIRRNDALARWEFWFNGSIVVTISTSDTRVSCWANGDTRAQWLTETWDGGDSVGHQTSTTHKETIFDTAIMQSSGEAGSHSPNWDASKACTYVQSGGNLQHCDRLSGSSFQNWSTG